MKILVIPIAALLLAGCTASDNDDASKKTDQTGDVKAAIPDVGSIIVDLPTSIAPGSGAMKLAGDGMEKIFLIPVELTGVAGTLTELNKDVIEHVFGKAVCKDDDASNDEGADCDEYSGLISGPVSETPSIVDIGVGGNSPTHVKYWKNAEGSAYDLSVDIYWKNADDRYVPGLKMQLSRTGEKTGKGELKYFPSSVSGTGPLVILTDFEATDAGKTMNIDMYYEPTGSGPSSMGLTLAETNGVITGAGNAIRPEQSADTTGIPPFGTKEEYAFVFTLAADSAANIGVEKLAIVQEAAYADDASFFSKYGVDGILKSFTISLLRNQAHGFDCSANGSYIDASLPSNICRSNTAVTDDQVMTGMASFCVTYPNNGLCEVAGQASKWANPIYLNARGYVGNENYQKPTTAAYAPLVEALSGISLYTPTAFKAKAQPALPEAVSEVE